MEPSNIQTATVIEGKTTQSNTRKKRATLHFTPNLWLSTYPLIVLKPKNQILMNMPTHSKHAKVKMAHQLIEIYLFQEEIKSKFSSVKILWRRGTVLIKIAANSHMELNNCEQKTPKDHLTCIALVNVKYFTTATNVNLANVVILCTKTEKLTK